MPRVAEFIYKYKETINESVSSAEIINFIYNETIVSRALLSSSVDYFPYVFSCESIVID